MGRADYFLLGAWNFICDQCGEKFKSPQAIKEWDGLYVCERCWDYRHPQDFIRGIPETAIPWSRPDTGGCNIPPIVPDQQHRFIDDTFIDSSFIG